jgi:hypothetical protein
MVAGLALMATMTACGNGGGVEACPAVYLLTGVRVDIADALAARVSGAAITVCWDGQCRTEQLSPWRMVHVPTPTCLDIPYETCQVEQGNADLRHSFAEMTDLPATPVRMTLTLEGARDAPLVTRTVRVTLEAGRLYNQSCGFGASARLKVDAAGRVTAS